MGDLATAIGLAAIGVAIAFLCGYGMRCVAAGRVPPDFGDLADPSDGSPGDTPKAAAGPTIIRPGEVIWIDMDGHTLRAVVDGYEVSAHRPAIDVSTCDAPAFLAGVPEVSIRLGLRGTVEYDGAGQEPQPSRVR